MEKPWMTGRRASSAQRESVPWWFLPLESQRDSAFQPRVVPSAELPWVNSPKAPQPQRGCAQSFAISVTAYPRSRRQNLAKRPGVRRSSAAFRRPTSKLLWPQLGAGCMNFLGHFPLSVTSVSSCSNRGGGWGVRGSRPSAKSVVKSSSNVSPAPCPNHAGQSKYKRLYQIP